jgi:hypothetical protein
MFEFTLAMMSNLKCLVILSAAVGGCAVFILTLLFVADFDCSREPFGVRANRVHLGRVLIVTVVCAIIGCIPDMNDMWKVRIGLIKYEMASPKNVNAAAEEIVRLGHKLECKYIGCEDETPKADKKSK